MKTSDFNYNLPEKLIAQEPPQDRGTSRMMVVHRDSGSIEHKSISDISDYLSKGDLLVVNNTRVFPARIFGHRTATGGKVELLLVEEIPGGRSQESGDRRQETGVSEHREKTQPSSLIPHPFSIWDCFLKARSRPDVGENMELANGRIQGEVMEVRGQRISIKLTCDEPLLDVLEEEGFAPVPPYIKRDYKSQESGVRGQGAEKDMVALDRERYQTVYADRVGAVAAPTAGLHFTENILKDLADKGVERAAVTLHVGPGTFKPVEVRDLKDHVMEAEWYDVSEETSEKITRTKATGGRIVAVGSTTVRTLETVASIDGTVPAAQGKSSIFIHPPYEFKAVDMMLTNFHLPESSLIMMVSALASRELIMKAYQEAIDQEYRFYSYGDCMLIL